MKLPFSQLKAIKQLNLPEIIQSYNIDLKYQTYNNQYVGLCPFHDDKNPSLHVSFKNEKWVWHCFGCHASGNVIDFIIKKEGVSFIKAYQRLEEQLQVSTPAVKEEYVSEPKVIVNREKLLLKVTDYYHDQFKTNPRGIEYLKKRGITSLEMMKHYKIGFVDGTMKNTLNQQTIEQLRDIGIINEKGNEKFYNCVVFPIFDEKGNVVSLYGRNIDCRSHLYLKGQHKGVFNGAVAKVSKELILTESIIDSFSLIQMGITNAIPIYGTSGFTEDHVNLLKNNLTKKVYICLDADQAGRAATNRLEKELEVMGIDTVDVKLPDVNDINEYLLKGYTKKDFKGLMVNTQIIKRAEPDDKPQGIVKAGLTPGRVKEKVNPQVVVDDEQLHFNFQERQYRLRGFNVNRLDQLKVNLKVSSENAFHLDTLDLYNARARDNFITQAKRSLKLENGYIHRDLTFIVDHLEDLQSKHLEGNNQSIQPEAIITKEEREDALAFLTSENLMDYILNDFKQCGHVGEESNLLMGYLAGISRKLATPLAVLIISRSASGKTTLQDAILSFTPPEDYEKYTRLTDQALFYKGKDSLKHKLLAIEEQQGASGCAYSLRNLQSGGCLSIATTSKDADTGKLKTETYKVEGPTTIMVTTTASDELDFETFNRFIVLTVDESTEQTKRILEQQRLNESIEGIIAKKRREKIRTKHHNAQRLLRPLEVANPYSNQLTFIDTILRARREQPKYLNMIKVVALLRQYQKEIKTTIIDNEQIEYIEVDLKDIEITNKIANEILGRNLDELCPPARNLLIEIKRMVDELSEQNGGNGEDVSFNRRDIRQFTKWSDYQVRCHLKQLEELEYVYPVKGSPGKQYSYKLLWDGQGTDGHKFMMGLIQIEDIKKAAQL